jgi:hypothetical protein
MKRQNKKRQAKSGRTRHSSNERARKPPRTAAQYNVKPEKFKDTWARVISVIFKLRNEKTSLTKAAQERGISPRTVKRWARSALQKRANGKWSPTKSDRLLREMKIPTSEGKRDILVRGSRQATLLAEYWNAVDKYLSIGDASKLVSFEGKFFKDANGVQIPFLTDRAVLDRMGSAGVLSFESLYVR